MRIVDKLRSDLARAEKRLQHLAQKKPDHKVALVMHEADVFRARRALQAFEEAAQQRTHGGLVRPTQEALA